MFIASTLISIGCLDRASRRGRHPLSVLIGQSASATGRLTLAPRLFDSHTPAINSAAIETSRLLGVAVAGPRAGVWRGQRVSTHRCSGRSSGRPRGDSPSMGRRAPGRSAYCSSACRPGRTGRSCTGHSARSGSDRERSPDPRADSWDSGGSTGPAPAAAGWRTACDTANTDDTCLISSPERVAIIRVRNSLINARVMTETSAGRFIGIREKCHLDHSQMAFNYPKSKLIK